jgi:putative DNA primase/helicase
MKNEAQTTTTNRQIQSRATVVPITTEIGVITEFNKIYTTLVHSGKNYVLRQGTDAFGCAYLEFFTQKDFIDAHRDAEKVETVVYGGNGAPAIKHINPAKLWIESPDSTAAKHGLTFHPKECRFHQGKLNTYMGRGCDPISATKNDVKIYLNHIYKVICDSDKPSYEYVIKWLAHLFQKPEEKPEVAIVLKAGQGTGKGTFIDPIGKIIGSHYLHAQSPEQVIGKFNAQLENKLLVFADEFFAGSKGSTDRLKTMITESVGSIERKGQDRIQVPCFARIIMATNHENVIKIERDERRYLYLEVSEKYKQDAEYFDKLHSAINQPDFCSKLLGYFLDFDITSFSPRNVPKTKALTNQKIDNLEPLDKWLYSILKAGGLAGEGWAYHVPSSDLTNHAEDWLEHHKLSVWGDVSRKVGILLSNIKTERVKKRDGDKHIWYRQFKSLDETRQKFSEYLKADLEWD